MKECHCVINGLIDPETGLNNFTPEKLCRYCENQHTQATIAVAKSNALYAEIKKEHPGYSHDKVMNEFKKRKL